MCVERLTDDVEWWEVSFVLPSAMLLALHWLEQAGNIHLARTDTAWKHAAYHVAVRVEPCDVGSSPCISDLITLRRQTCSKGKTEDRCRCINLVLATLQPCTLSHR